MILFTADIDWAPEEIIVDIIELFEQYNICCTFFATHNSPVLTGCNKDLFEIGLHPNFNPLFQGKGGDAGTIISELKKHYPEAIGIRSHSLTQSGWLLNKFKEMGMLYEVNHFLPYFQGLKPFVLWNGMIRIPFNWEDDYHFALGYDFNDSRINLTDEGMNIFNFHPVHTFLNSENNDRYLRIKDFMSDTEKIKEEVNSSKIKGTRDMLISLLEYVKKNDLRTHKLKDIYLSNK